VNNKYFRKTITDQDQYLDIPLEINFDMLGREDGVASFENEVISEILNPISDFEITKFAHSDWQFNFTIQTPFGPTNINLEGTNVNYEFYFFDYLTGVTASTSSNWATDYENATFTDSEIYYFANSFKGSFFKLDFYDSPQNENQSILLSVILPTQQGLKEPGTIGPPLNQTSVLVKKPNFVLDYTGADKEGFYIYWLKDEEYLKITEFYVSAKFFNAKTGQFVRMMNRPQSTFIGQNMFNLDKPLFFYYKYVLDYNTNEYKVYTYNNNFQNAQRVGTGILPIKWYEYVNP
jgi:hypothetical protein